MHNLSCSKEVSTGSEHDGSQAPPGSKQRRDGGGRRSSGQLSPNGRNSLSEAPPAERPSFIIAGSSRRGDGKLQVVGCTSIGAGVEVLLEIKSSHLVTYGGDWG
jgi:hypothetical protein